MIDRILDEHALDDLLEREPTSVPGHIGKGDCRLRDGDTMLATYFYQTALELAAGKSSDESQQAELARAEQALRGLQDQASRDREERLASRGVAASQWSPRFRHALDVAAGKRRVYRQLPTAFNYPELPHVQFFDADQFDWAAPIEAATGAIHAELAAILEQGDDEFRAYIRSGAASVPLASNKALLDSKDWSVVTLCENGWIVPSVVERCPRTWEAILRAPVPRVAGFGPTIVFSMLKAGAHIAPHTGMYNTRLICHLPLIVPAGCRFRVGNEVREWQVGKLMIFDDTIEHEAWNDGADDRVILIFDVWRPELSERERIELTALFSD